MTQTLADVKREAQKLGATVTDEVVGRTRETLVQAPSGKVWACDGSIHELVGSVSTMDRAWAAPMFRDLLDRMAGGLEDCQNADCEWCHEVRA